MKQFVILDFKRENVWLVLQSSTKNLNFFLILFAHSCCPCLWLRSHFLPGSNKEEVREMRGWCFLSWVAFVSVDFPHKLILVWDTLMLSSVVLVTRDFCHSWPLPDVLVVWVLAYDFCLGLGSPVLDLQPLEQKPRQPDACSLGSVAHICSIEYTLMSLS